MDLTLTDLLQLPILREAHVINERSYDPYRPVAPNCLDRGDRGDSAGSIFCRPDSTLISATIAATEGWPAVCVVSSTEARPPTDPSPTFEAAISSAAQRQCALLWLHSDQEPEELQLRFCQELLAYHDTEIAKCRRIQRRLNEIVIGGGTLQEVCKTLALLTESPVSIKTSYHDVVACHNVGAPDSARRRTNEAGQVPPDILQALHDAELPSRLQHELGAFRFGPLPEIDYHTRVMAPIRAESCLWGYISVAECTHRLGLLDLSAVEAAANCVALIVWKDRALAQRAREQQSQFIGDLLFADQDTETLAARALLLGYEPSERYSVVIFEWNTPSGTAATALHGDRRCRALGRAVDEYLATQGCHTLVHSIPIGDRVVCLWPSSGGDPENHTSRLIPRLREALGFEDLRVGLGGAPALGEGLAAAYRHAQLALWLTPGTEQVAAYRGLGVARLIVEDLDGDAAEAFAREHLAPLDSYDTDHRRELVKTLDTYYRCGRNFVRAAERLFVHLNTVKYRLRRVTELTGLDPDDPHASLDFQVALLIRRMGNRTRTGDGRASMVDRS